MFNPPTTPGRSPAARVWLGKVLDRVPAQAGRVALHGVGPHGAARVMGMDDQLGSIEPDKLADLILVDGDPTADISDIRRVVTVIKDGRVYDPAAIYRALGIRPCCEE